MANVGGGLEAAADVHAATNTTLAVKHVAAVAGAHPGAEAEFTGTLDQAAALGVVRGHRKRSYASQPILGLPAVR